MDRNVTQEDINAVARGLNLIGKSPMELEQLMAQHQADAALFGSRVIHLAAKQMLRVKLGAQR